MAKENKGESNYVTNSPSMRVRGPQSKGASPKNQTKKYSPRVMRPLAKVANIEKNAKDSLKRPMVKPHKRHLGKIEALPFMSREEKENEEIQVDSVVTIITVNHEYTRLVSLRSGQREPGRMFLTSRQQGYKRTGRWIVKNILPHVAGCKFT